MHIAEGQLRAYLDHELTGRDQDRVQTHLGSCPDCRLRAQTLARQAERVQEHLATLTLLPAEAPRSNTMARARFKSLVQERENTSMSRKIFSRQYLRVWAVVGAIAILAVALAVPSVRAIANNFLGLFRVEKVAVVGFDEQSLNDRLNAATQFGEFVSNDVTQERIGEYRVAANAAEASALAGIPVRLPSTIVEGEPFLDVFAGERVSFTIDLPRLRALMNQLGVENLDLPAALDGQTITLEINPGVSATYGDCRQGRNISGDYSPPKRCTAISQTLSPTISAPPGLDLARIGEAMLQVLGMSPAQAAAFSNTVDWTTTLVMPLPQNNTTYRYVTVDGVEGVLIEYRDFYQGERYNQSMLIWVKDGICYSINTRGWSPNIFEIANSLK